MTLTLIKVTVGWGGCSRKKKPTETTPLLLILDKYRDRGADFRAGETRTRERKKRERVSVSQLGKHAFPGKFEI